MDITWKPVVGYEGVYEVSSCGLVRRVAGKFFKTLRPYPNYKGYMCVALRKGGVAKVHRVHRLVITAFVGEAPEGMTVNHKDGVKTNNHVENLEYMTASENTLHGLRTGLINPARGSKHWASKLTEDDVAAIRSSPYGHAEVARQYGVSTWTIEEIRARRMWKHVS